MTVEPRLRRPAGEGKGLSILVLSLRALDGIVFSEETAPEIRSVVQVSDALEGEDGSNLVKCTFYLTTCGPYNAVRIIKGEHNSALGACALTEELAMVAGSTKLGCAGDGRA